MADTELCTPLNVGIACVGVTLAAAVLLSATKKNSPNPFAKDTRKVSKSIHFSTFE